MIVECMECGKEFRTSNTTDPECPKCGSTDLEVAEPLTIRRPERGSADFAALIVVTVITLLVGFIGYSIYTGAVCK